MEALRFDDSVFVKTEQVRLHRDVRDAVGKYTGSYGELLMEVAREEVRCIRKQKLVRYIADAVRNGREPNLKALDRRIREEMEDYERRLRHFEETALTEDAYTASEREVREMLSELASLRLYEEALGARLRELAEKRGT
ncbi:MAG: hypothetical protein IJL78_04615 [Lachnospiraceae bacterium]|nr:hypothetical protein [Lachnospiraceae bacterium]